MSFAAISARRRLDVGEVGVVIALERRGHGDDVGVCLRGLGLRRELALCDDSGDDGLETLLDERNRAGVDRIDIRLLDVNADHSLAGLREDRLLWADRCNRGRSRSLYRGGHSGSSRNLLGMGRV